MNKYDTVILYVMYTCGSERGTRSEASTKVKYLPFTKLLFRQPYFFYYLLVDKIKLIYFLGNSV